MARKPNQWNFTSARVLDQLTSSLSREGLADRLGVSPDTIRNWASGSIPSNRFQIAMANLASPVKKSNIGTVSDRIINYLKATRMSVESFAEIVGKSEATVMNWIDGKSNPRSLSLLNSVLQNPQHYPVLSS